MRDGCPFCEFDGEVLWQLGTETGGVIVFEPLNPITPGHVLVVPRKHVRDAMEDPVLTGQVFQVAAEYARYLARDYYGDEGQFNFITSAGENATQSVFHLHIHVLPRKRGDGLLLPWTMQDRGRRVTIAMGPSMEPVVRFVPILAEGPLRA